MKCIIMKPYIVVVSEQSVSNMVPNMDTKDIIIITRFHFSIICILKVFLCMLMLSMIAMMSCI